MESRSVLDCVYVFCMHGPSPLAQEIPTVQCLSRPTHISYSLLVEPLVNASAGTTRPLYGIVRGILAGNSRLCGGYELDIYLLCSAHPRYFVALFSLLFEEIQPF